MSFQRARSDEQRAQRRRAVLETTRAMLAEMPVSEISLSEISRRVGLAKSNVLRYVESREAALLDVLHAELGAWLEALNSTRIADGSLSARADDLGRTLARTLTDRAVLCDLLAAQFSVLEHNVSIELAARHKHRLVAATHDLAARFRTVVPELDADPGFRVASGFLLFTGSIWTACRPASAVVAAFAADPSLRVLQLDFARTIEELVPILVHGVLAGSQDDRR